MLCPVKNENWVRLVGYLNSGDKIKAEIEAYRVFKAQGENTPPAPPIAMLKEQFGITDGATTQEQQESIKQAVNSYNEKHSVSHSVEFHKNYTTLTLNFMPKKYVDLVDKKQLTSTKNTKLLKVNTIGSPDSIPSLLEDSNVARNLRVEKQLEQLMTLKKIANRLLIKSKIFAKEADDQKAAISKVLDEAIKLHFGVLFSTNDNVDDIDLQANQYSEAIIGFYNYIMQYELPLYKDSGDDPDVISSSRMNAMYDAIDLYKDVTREIESLLAIDGAALPSKIWSQIKDTHTAMKNEISTLDIMADRDMKTKLQSIVEEEMPKDVEYNMSELLDDSIAELSTIHRWFGSVRNAPDELLRMIFKTIVFQKKQNYREIISHKNALLDKQLLLEKEGFNDMSIFHDKYNGKKTGYIISRYKWGEYYAAMSEAREDIRKELNVETLPSYTDLTDNQKEVWDKRWKVFQKEYMIKTAGVYVPNKNRLKNDEFLKLMDNPVFADYYNELKSSLEESKGMLPKQYQDVDGFEFQLPQIRKTVLESLKGKGAFKSIIERGKESVLKSDQDTEYGSNDVILDYNNNPVKLVPIHYVSPLENPDDLSSDVTSMAIFYRDMALNFSTMSKKIEDVKIIQRHIASKTFKTKNKSGSGDKSNAATLLETFLDSEVYGIASAQIVSKIGNKELNWSKLIDKTTSFIRANNLVMQPFTIISGATKASIDFFLDKVAEKYTSLESSRWAEIELDKNLISLMDNVLKRKKTGKMCLMFEYNGLYGGLEEQFKKLDVQNRAMRVTGSKLMYSTYELADVRIRGKLALSIYNNHRLINGEYITKSKFNTLYKNEKSPKYNKDFKWSDFKNETLYDAYEVSDGAFKVKKDYQKYVTSDLENRIQSTIDYRVATVTGQLSSHDKTTMGRTIVGKFLMLHRNWMISGWTERMKKQTVDYTTGEAEEGYYRTFGKWIAMMMQESGGIKQKLAVWGDLDHYQKGNVKKMAGDLAFYALCVLAANLFNGMADDEPDEYWLQFLAMQVSRIRLEQTAFLSLSETLNVINSPTAGKQLIESVSTSFKLITDFDKIEYGSYEGMYRWQKALIKNSIAKGVWETRNAESIAEKRKFIVSQIFN